MEIKITAEDKKVCRGLFSFIENSPTCFHTVENVRAELENSGYEALCESGSWTLRRGGKYYVTRNMSSVIAFRIPENDYSGFMIAASHSDSPTFRIKDSAENITGDGYVQLLTERYGGMIYSTWLDRPLSVAGRIVVKTENGAECKLVNIAKDLVLIPNVAIHMNRNANENCSYNPAVDLLPLYSLSAGKASLIKQIARAAHVTESDIIGTDLFLYNRQKGAIWGENDEFISSPRLDDLQCVYSSLCAFLSSKDSGSIPMLCVFDNEEVGSLTKQGADSTFLSDTISRINEIFEKKETESRKTIANSFMVSADNAHAVHPNHPEYADKNNRPVLNGGVVIKFNANQRYTTDGVSAAAFRIVCGRAGVRTQVYTNRADIAGGSTLGNISTAHVSLNCVDIGLPQLAMHSSYETAGAADTHQMINALREFFGSSLRQQDAGHYSI